MMTIRRAAERGHANHGWLDTWHSFSFDTYHDPAHVQFGPLRVLNEDFVAPGAGFPPHQHRDMEIITIVLEGAVAHQDSSGGEGEVRPGDVQVMTAGSGVVHSEFNPSDSEPLHLLQIWIMPDARGHTPRYDQRTFGPETRKNVLLKVVSGGGGGGGGTANGALQIHQDAALYVSELGRGRTLTHALAPGRRVYLFVTKGTVAVNGQPLAPSDAAMIEGEPSIEIKATAPSGLVLMDLP
jgi:redox-sensitive bicupin YhaK (pirin superfamily)